MLFAAAALVLLGGWLGFEAQHGRAHHEAARARGPSERYSGPSGAASLRVSFALERPGAVAVHGHLELVATRVPRSFDMAQAPVAVHGPSGDLPHSDKILPGSAPTAPLPRGSPAAAPPPARAPPLS